MIHKVSLAFAYFADEQVAEFSLNVITGMGSNSLIFDGPPVSLIDLGANRIAFVNAVQAAAQGGTQLTAFKDQNRDIVIANLRQNASFVQTVANNDLPTLLLSGYTAATPATNAQSPLDKPTLVQLTNGMSGQLLARMPAIHNAHAYEARTSSLPAVYMDAGAFISTRRMELNGLTPGTVYTVQFRAIGGSEGYSDWSDPVSHMAM
jgi:hypothetical protein